ncbi:hypothetical protein AAG906_033391 [Vitis piasezkii]
MDDMRAKGRGEHVVQPFADGANGWLVWEVSPSWSFRRVRVIVPHHWGDQGVTMRVFQALVGLVLRALNLTTEIFYHVVFLLKNDLTLHAPGMAPAVSGYIDSSSGLEFATWPLEPFSCLSLANCLLSMARRHSKLSSSPLPDDRLREGVAIFASD